MAVEGIFSQISTQVEGSSPELLLSLFKMLNMYLAGGAASAWNPVPDLGLFTLEAMVAD